MDAPRDQHGEHPVAPCDRPLDNLAVVRLSGNDGDASVERVEFSHAALAAHADHLIAAIQRVLTMYCPSFPDAPTMQTLILRTSPAGSVARLGAVRAARRPNPFNTLSPLCNAAAMNLLGRRSLSSFFKVLLDFAFYVACLVSALLVVVAVVVSRTDTSKVSVSLPVRFEIDPSAYLIQGTGGAAVDARMRTPAARRVTGPPVAFVALPIVGVIGVLGVVLVVLHRMRRVFRRLVEGRPFLDENARSLRFIGLAVVAGEVVWAAFQYLGQRALTGGLSSAEISFHAAFDPSLCGAGRPGAADRRRDLPRRHQDARRPRDRTRDPDFARGRRSVAPRTYVGSRPNAAGGRGRWRLL